LIINDNDNKFKKNKNKITLQVAIMLDDVLK